LMVSVSVLGAGLVSAFPPSGAGFVRASPGPGAVLINDACLRVWFG
jgi:hypothetical protein